MFERLVESILVEYVSEWVEGLDAEKMKIAVFSGTVEFRDLQLKTSALDKFQLPVKIKIGRLGRLAMKVPWKRLTKEAVKIQIEDLFLLIVPVHQEERERAKSHPGVPADDSEDSYALRQRWAKQQEVRMRELFEKNKGENGTGDVSSTGEELATSWGYRERMLHNVLDNVSFEFSKIHIRYEDTTQLLSKNPLALGLTIDSIVVNTTNANGHNVFIDRSQSHTPFVHKNLDVLRTGLYCENTLSAEQLEATRRAEHPRLGAYIVRPFNASVKMTINHDDATAYSIPKLQCVVDISTIQAAVTPDQCNDMISVVNFVSTHELYLKRIHCRRQRPTVPVKSNVKEWWRYAVFGVQVMYSIRAAAKRLSSRESTSGTSRSRAHQCDWKTFGTLWLSRKQYIHLHKKMLRAAAKKTAVEALVEDRCRANELEDTLDVQTIVFFRLCATQELEAEDSRVESGKKLSGWKARFNSRAHNAETSADGAKRRLDISEKMLIYCAVNDQIHASSAALLQRQEEKKSSATILFAVDVAISSVQLLLVEPRPTNATGGLGRVRLEVPAQTFMQFELDKIVFAIFQRACACNISSSIGSGHMLDFSQTDQTNKDEILPRALFSMIDMPIPAETTESGSLAPSKTRLLELSIDASKDKFKLDCKVTPFRYVHHIAVETKLRAYFSSQVEVASVLKENAEEAFVYSSMWINKAVFDSYKASEQSDGDQGGQLGRKVECSIKLPKIDLLVLSSDISPVLHAQLVSTSFCCSNLLEEFTFSIESIEILFLDGIAQLDGRDGSIGQAVSTVAGYADAPKRLQHQDARKCVTVSDSDGAANALRQQYFDFSRRKQSTILRKTRLVFVGEKIVERSRIAKWVLKCTAPPIFFTLSSRQYHQVVQASVSWAQSSEVSDLMTSAKSKSADALVHLPTSAVGKRAEAFDPEDERLCLSVLIPQIVIIFEGEDKDEATHSSTSPVTPASNSASDHHELLGMDLVLDIKEASVEARISSVAQAIGVNTKTFTLSKREKRVRQSATDRDCKTGKREKMPSADAIAEINKESEASHAQCLDSGEPEPAYNFATKRPALKLLEVGPTISLLISSVDPFKCSITVNRVSLYWDQELLITLLRSYLFDEPLLRSAFSSRASSRSSSQSSSRTSSESGVKATCCKPQDDTSSPEPPTVPNEQLAPYFIEVRITELFLFLRPQTMASHCFSIRLSGRDIAGTISTLDTPTFVSISFELMGGAALDSYRLLGGNASSQPQMAKELTEENGKQEVCRLLETSDPVRFNVETVGYGKLSHRTDAGVFVQIAATGIDMNFVCPYYALLLEYIQRDILGFFSWFEVMTRPPNVAGPNDRTKLNIRAKQVRLVVPRAGFGTSLQQQRLEHVLVVVNEVALGSRPTGGSPSIEQLGIKLTGVRISTCSSAQALTACRPHSGRSTTLFMEQSVVFVEVTTKPLPVETKKKRSEQAVDPTKAAKNIKHRHCTLEMQEIIRRMQSMFTRVKVSVDEASVWLQDDDDSRRKPLKPRLDLSPRHVAINADPQQLELIMCIVQENLGRSEVEIDPVRLSTSLLGTEKLMTDIDIDLGSVELNLSMADSSSSLASHEPNEATRCRVIGRIELQDVRIAVNQFSTLRSQCRVNASSAMCWKVDWVQVNLSGGSEGKSKLREVLTTCAELYESTAGDNTMRSIDVTVDTHPPPLNKTCSPAPLDVRVHVDTCAVSPPLVQLGLRLKPFFATEPTLLFYTPKAATATTVSISTGVTHVLVAEYVPERSHHVLNGSDNPANAEDQSSTGLASLKLIVSGCIVVRITLGEDETTHVQVYGRKMSLEVASKWPPEPTIESAGSPAASPLASTRSRRGTDTTSTDECGAYTIMSLPSNYRRVLCEDFALDMDIFDTNPIDQTTTVSASLTHFHAVLCVFDAIMLLDLGSMEWSDDLYEKLLNELTSGASKRSTSSRHPRHDTSKSAELSPTATRSSTVVTIMLEDASVTFVREIGEYFSPVARMYSYCIMCKVSVESQHLPTLLSTGDAGKPQLPPTQVVDVVVHFSEDVAGSELRDDDGVSMWGFNSTLGAWEPILEPWMFTLAIQLSCEASGRTVTKLSLNGSENHALNVNFSPTMLESFCVVVKEFDEALRAGKIIRPSTARVISCGFYLANDCGLEISYWVSNHSDTTSHISRGYTYAPRNKRVPEILPPRQKVPLKLSTAIFPSLPTDQVVSFSWGDDWYPLTDVRIHNAGKYIYSVQPKKGRRACSSEEVSPASPTNSQHQSPQILLALFDISAVFGYRTLTVSSLVRIFNDTNVTVDCGILGADGKSVVDIGTVEANDAIGVPMDAIPSLWSVRVFVKPHTTPDGTSSSKNYRWSNDIFISETEENTEHLAACSLMLDDYDCRCQRMFDGSQPLHVSQTCRSNGGYFRVWSHVMTSSNASSLKYAQLHVLPPLTFENKCGVPVYVVAFVFKKVHRAGGGEREYFHLVASEKVPAHGSFEFLASSLHESTFCSISLTGFSWSNLFLLPNSFQRQRSDGDAANANLYNLRSDLERQTGHAGGAGGSGMGMTGSEIVCSLLDFKSRPVTVNVAFQTAYQDRSDVRKVVIQPRFVIRNSTPLPLTFAPHVKVMSKLSNAKSLFSLPGSPKKQVTSQCCGSPQLEMLHSKLNELNGATTTPSSPLSKLVGPGTLNGTPGQAKSRGGDGSSFELDETECFYCSDVEEIDVQLEGNALSTSGVQQFRLDGTMGGTNASLRLFDESAKRWCDLVAIVTPVDASTTRVTFVERYLVVNRSEFELVCAPSCDIRTGAQNTRAEESGAATRAAAGAGNDNADHFMVLAPRSTTAFSWTLRTVIPTDACVRFKLNGVGTSAGGTAVVAVTEPGWRWSGKVSLHEVSESALKLSNRYSNQMHVIKVEVRVESAIRVFVVISSEDVAPFPLYRIINSSTQETIFIKQSFDSGAGELSESSVATSALYSRGVPQRVAQGETVFFGWDEAFFLQSLDRVLAISYGTGDDNILTKVLLDQPGEARRVELPKSKTRMTESHVYVHWYLHGITKTVHVHDAPLPRDKQTGKPLLPADDSSSAENKAAAATCNALEVHLRLPRLAFSILTTAPEELLLLSAEDADVKYAVTDGEHDQFEFKLGALQLDNQLDDAIFPVVFTALPSATTGTMQLPFSDSATDKRKAKDKAAGAATAIQDESTHSTATGAKSDALVHVSLLRLRYGDGVEYIKYLSVMLRPVKLQVDDVLLLESATLAADCFQAVQRTFNPSAASTPNTGAQAPGSASTGAGPTTARNASTSIESREAFARRRAWSDAAPIALAASTSLSPGINDDDQWSAVSAETSRPGKSAVVDSVDAVALPPAERRMYIELLELHPLRVQLTFQPNDQATDNGVNSASTSDKLKARATYFDSRATALLPLVFVLLQSRIANVDCASLALNALHVTHAFTTHAFLLGAVRQHYTIQGARQLYALVGAADVLGNPLGLVTNLGAGVRDFFYEPMAGLVQSPQEFVLGLSRGTASLVRHSVYGTFNAASKFTGTLSAGVAALSLDRAYMRERDARNRRDVATHFGTGLFYGTKQLGQGIMAGVTGVVTAPARGAMSGGLAGFVEGVGKGLIGVAVKPAAGVLDLAAKTTAGITATATAFDRKPRATRSRLPRLLRRTRDTRLRVYCHEEARLAQLLRRLSRYLLPSELYEAHVFLPGSRALLATSFQLLYVIENSGNAAGGAGSGMTSNNASMATVAAGVAALITDSQRSARVVWAFPLASVWGAQRVARGVSIHIGSSSGVELSGAISASPAAMDESGEALILTRSSMSAVLVPIADANSSASAGVNMAWHGQSVGDNAATFDRVLQFVSELVARQRERTPRSDSSAPPPRNSIGLVLEPVSPDVSDCDKSQGGRVVEVLVGSPCFRAGVEVGDVVVGFAGKKLEPGDHGSSLRLALSLMQRGETLELLVQRHGQVRSFNVAAE